MSATVALPFDPQASSPVCAPQRPHAVVERLEPTPRGRYVRVRLQSPVRVPYAWFFKRLVAAGGYPDVPPDFNPAPLVKSVRMAAGEIRARDIREGDTVELGLTWNFAPEVKGPVLYLRPAWAVPFAPAQNRAGEVRHA